MSCANSGITLFALIIAIFSIWSIVGVETTKWIIVISAILIVIFTWTGTECKWCKNTPKNKKK